MGASIVEWAVGFMCAHHWPLVLAIQLFAPYSLTRKSTSCLGWPKMSFIYSNSMYMYRTLASSWTLCFVPGYWNEQTLRVGSSIWPSSSLGTGLRKWRGVLSIGPHQRPNRVLSEIWLLLIPEFSEMALCPFSTFFFLKLKLLWVGFHYLDLPVFGVLWPSQLGEHLASQTPRWQEAVECGVGVASVDNRVCGSSIPGFHFFLPSVILIHFSLEALNYHSSPSGFQAMALSRVLFSRCLPLNWTGTSHWSLKPNRTHQIPPSLSLCSSSWLHPWR